MQNQSLSEITNPTNTKDNSGGVTLPKSGLQCLISEVKKVHFDLQNTSKVTVSMEKRAQVQVQNDVSSTNTEANGSERAMVP